MNTKVFYRYALIFSLILTVFVTRGYCQIMTWELAGQNGDQVSNASTTNATGLTPGTLTRGTGVVPKKNSNTMSADSWTSAAAIDLNDYYQFTVPVSGGYSADITTISVVLSRSSKGPTIAVLRSSLDAYGSNIGPVVTVGTAATRFTFTYNQIAIQGTLTFRLYGYLGNKQPNNSVLSVGPLAGNEIEVNGSVNPLPVITSFTPTSACSGSPLPVVITGSWFTGATSVTFNGTEAASFTVDSDTQITAYLPTAATSGPIGVTTHAGTTVSSGNFTIEPNNWIGGAAGSERAWNVASNWCGGIPLSTSDVLIPSDVTNLPQISSPGAVCNNLTIESGAVLTIDAGGQLTVDGTIDNQAGTSGLLIKSVSMDPGGTGSLIHNTIGVSATVERYMTGISETGFRNWHLISSPVADQGVKNFLLDNGNIFSYYYSGSNLRYALAPYIESTNLWDYFNDNDTDFPTASFIPGQGMEILIKDVPAGKVEFKGHLINGDVSLAVYRSIGTKVGWNLTGNPYPSGLSADLFIDGNPGILTEGYKAIYVADPYTGRYTAVNYLDGYFVPPGEGFFILAGAPGTIIFNNAMRSHNMADFKSRSISGPRIELTAQNGDIERNSSIHFIPGMTTGIDEGFDAVSFYSGTPEFGIYTRQINNSDKDFEIQTLPDDDYRNLVIPVAVTAPEGSDVTITANISGFIGNVPVYLEDRLTGVFTRLDVQGSHYTVKLEKGSQGAGRFYLHTGEKSFGNAPESIIPEADDLSIIPMPQYQKIHIAGTLTLPAKATILDMTGRVISSVSLTDNQENEIAINQMNNGVYLVVVETAKTVAKQKISWIK